MKITRIGVYQVDVPIKPATISHNRVMSALDETIVRIETDIGIDGWDVSATDVGVVLRAKEDGVLDRLNVKLARVGGISKTRLIRDLCVALNVPMEIQDSSYSDLACAVVAHMGHSTPKRCIRSAIYPKGLKKATVIDGPTVTGGRITAPDGPGIGPVPKLDAIGSPIAIYG